MSRIETIAEGVTLYLGDCREILPTLGKVDAVVTDPPYGMTYQSNYGVGAGSKPITNDGTRVSLRLYRNVVANLTGIPTLWCTRWDAWPDVWEIFAERGQLKGMLVWDKGHNGMGDLSHWGNSHELIASAGPIVLRGSRDGSVLTDFKPVPPNNRNHPTEKPVGLFEYLIGKITDHGQTVMDPFMGSGTTGIAAVKLGRRFCGIEIDQKYFDISCKRISDALKQPDMFIERPAPAKQEAFGL